MKDSKKQHDKMILMEDYRITNPKLDYVILNVILLVASFFVVIWIFPFSTNEPLMKYWQPYLVVYVPISIVFGLAFKKYHSYQIRSSNNVLISIFKSDIVSLAFSCAIVLIFPALKLSVFAFFAFVGVVLILEYIDVMIYFALKQAINTERNLALQEVSKKTTALAPNYLLDSKTMQHIETLVQETAGKKALQQLQQKTLWNYSNTLVVHTTNIFNVASLQENRYSTIINLSRCNNIRSINEFMTAVHDKLPYNGIFVGCFRSKSQYKKDFLARYVWGVNYLLYTLVYLLKRVFPKWAFTREIYFWLTGGRKRILAKPEILGRLYASGFEIVDEFRADGLNYFIAKKKNEPIRKEILNYGAIIKLDRVGKNGKMFKVYKFRTMHAYSEFLQPYIYENNHLQEGGKFRRDIRITSLGNFMRKYWLDELPMIFNLMKGDMKLVGVRPLSKHYFSLYSPELQEARTKVKPGLLPPFYADMPKDLDEIQNSEFKYLNQCKKNGTFVTDIKYLWLIFVNIVFRKARSH